MFLGQGGVQIYVGFWCGDVLSFGALGSQLCHFLVVLGCCEQSNSVGTRSEISGYSFAIKLDDRNCLVEVARCIRSRCIGSFLDESVG